MKLKVEAVTREAKEIKGGRNKGRKYWGLKINGNWVNSFVAVKVGDEIEGVVTDNNGYKWIELSGTKKAETPQSDIAIMARIAVALESIAKNLDTFVHPQQFFKPAPDTSSTEKPIGTVTSVEPDEDIPF